MLETHSLKEFQAALARISATGEQGGVRLSGCQETPEATLDLTGPGEIFLENCAFESPRSGPIMRIGPKAHVDLRGVVFYGSTMAPLLVNYGFLVTRDLEFINDQGQVFIGGAVLNLGVWRSTHLKVRRSRARLGGGIGNLGGLMKAMELDMAENQAEFGGAIFNKSGRMEIDSPHVQANLAQQRGGGIYNSGGWVKLTKGEIRKNLAEEFGGGLANEDGGHMALNGTRLSENLTKAQPFPNGGGALYNQDAECLVQSGEFIDNEVPLSSYGGALLNYGGTLVLGTHDDDPIIRENKAGDGGAVANITGARLSGRGRFVANSAPGGRGGGFYNSQSRVDLTKSYLGVNESNEGGGVFNDRDSDFNFSQGSIEGNKAKIAGGGILNYGRLNLTESELQKNRTEGPGGGLATDAQGGQFKTDDPKRINQNKAGNNKYPDLYSFPGKLFPVK